MGVLNLDSIIQKWVERWNDVDENEEFEIDWTKVHFATGSSQASPVQQQKRRNRRGAGNGSQRSQIVFSSDYVNNTTEVQTHTFKIERTTEAIVRTKLSKGFARNGNVGIKIDIPDQISNATSSFGNDVEIVHQDENTVKHAVKWSLDSTVNAKPSSRTTAEMYIRETQYEFTFEAEIHIRGKVIVRLSDGRVVTGKIATIMSDAEENEWFDNDGMMTIQGSKVTWNVEGSLTFKFGVAQDTSVSSSPLEEDSD